jgi:hypothetical protein
MAIASTTPTAMATNVAARVTASPANIALGCHCGRVRIHMEDGASGRCLRLASEPRGRRGRYRVAWLMVRHGGAKLTDLLQTLADCPKARSVISRQRNLPSGG